MKLEKRSEGGPIEPPEETPKGKKPVVIYIMVLFIAAFLLMAWSFASHQRSNTEALGKLQDSVTAMQEVQDLQDQVIALQKELAEAKESIEDLQKDSGELEGQLTQVQQDSESLAKEQDALLSLYALMQEYAARDYESCQAIIQRMEANGKPEILEGLTASGHGDITPPHTRYLELKEAVEAAKAREEAS